MGAKRTWRDRPGLHARADDGRIEPALPRRDCDLAQLLLRRGREPAKGFHLELVGDGANQETAPQRRGRVAIEGTPTLPECLEAEGREVQRSLFLRRASHRLARVFAVAFGAFSVRLAGGRERAPDRAQAHPLGPSAIRVEEGADAEVAPTRKGSKRAAKAPGRGSKRQGGFRRPAGGLEE